MSPPARATTACLSQPVRGCSAHRPLSIWRNPSLCFGERVERNVARIEAHAIRLAALQVAASYPDCMFLSCTNLRTLEINADLERDTGCTVLSSDQVPGWHMARLAQIAVHDDTAGQLFRGP